MRMFSANFDYHHPSHARNICVKDNDEWKIPPFVVLEGRRGICLAEDDHLEEGTDMSVLECVDESCLDSPV